MAASQENSSSRKRVADDEPINSISIEALEKEIETLKKLVSSKNIKLGELYNDLLDSREETKKANEFINDFKEEICQGLLQIIRKIQQFPSIFSCTSEWHNYSNIEFLNQVKEWGGELFYTFITDILDRTTILLRGERAKIKQKERDKTMVLIFSHLFKDIMPNGGFQSVFGWTFALVMKAVTKSTQAIDMISSIFPGAPGSAVLLDNEMFKAVQNISSRSTTPLGTYKINLRWAADNAPVGNYKKGCSSIASVCFNKIVTLVNCIFFVDKSLERDAPFTQNDPNNDPRKWEKEYSKIPLDICDITIEEHALLKAFALSEIQTDVDDMIKTDVKRGDGSQDNNEKIIIKAKNRVQPSEEFYREGYGEREKNVNTSLGEVHNLNENKDEDKKDSINRSDNENGNEVKELVEGKEDNGSDSDGDGDECYYEDEDEDMNNNSKNDDNTNSDIDNTTNDNTTTTMDIESCKEEVKRPILFLGHVTRLKSAVAAVGNLLSYVMISTYLYCIKIHRCNLLPKNPGNAVVQEELRDRILIESCVSCPLNPPGLWYRNHVELCTDLGAWPRFWWLFCCQIVHIIGLFHLNYNMLIGDMKCICSGDNEKSFSLARVCEFGSISAQKAFRNVTDTHKGIETCEKVIYPAMLRHLVQSTYDRNLHINLNDKTAAEQIYDAIHEPGGGATFENFRAQVFEVSMMRKCVRVSSKRGPDFFLLYFAARKKLLLLAIALGETWYVPALMFDTFLYSFLLSEDMRTQYRHFYVTQTEEEHRRGVAFKGSDEIVEEHVKGFKGLLTSLTYRGAQVANWMSSTYESLVGFLFNWMDLKKRDSRQRNLKDLSKYKIPMIQFFNHYGPGRREDINNTILTSYDRSEIRDSEYGIDKILIKGEILKKKAIKYFKENGGKFNPVSASLLPTSFFAYSKTKN